MIQKSIGNMGSEFITSHDFPPQLRYGTRMAKPDNIPVKQLCIDVTVFVPRDKPLRCIRWTEEADSDRAEAAVMGLEMEVVIGQQSMTPCPCRVDPNPNMTLDLLTSATWQMQECRHQMNAMQIQIALLGYFTCTGFEPTHLRRMTQPDNI
jgi:hypothetical protein